MTNTSRSLDAPDTTVLETVLRRDRLILVTALVAVTAIAWIWVLLGAGTGMSTVAMTRRSGMPDLTGMIMEPAVWTLGYAGLMFAMWWVMMVAMMLPSATPMLLLFARINRKGRAGDRPYVPVGIFAAGYLVAWGGFSIIATALQWLLEQLGLLSPMMVTTSYWLGGAILVLAGSWQLTPIKGVCLRHCRSPLSFLVQSWRPGRLGAFRMGTRARRLLFGVLLVSDGPAVLRRYHELVLDCRPRRLRLARKDDPPRPLGRTGRRHRCRCLWRADARERREGRVAGDWLSGREGERSSKVRPVVQHTGSLPLLPFRIRQRTDLQASKARATKE